MNEITIYLIIFFSAIALIVLLLNIWSKGFVWVFLRTRGRRDKGQLVLVNSASDAYFRQGRLDGEFLIYTDRNKNKKRLTIAGATPRRIFGLPVWETDEEKNALISGRLVKGILGRSKEIQDETSPNLIIRSWETVTGHDPVKVDNLYERTLTAPTIKDNKQLIMLVAVLLIILITGFIAYKTIQIEKAIAALNVVINTPSVML